jgi:hypothetical protein
MAWPPAKLPPLNPPPPKPPKPPLAAAGFGVAASSNAMTPTPDKIADVLLRIFKLPLFSGTASIEAPFQGGTRFTNNASIPERLRATCYFDGTRLQCAIVLIGLP